MAQRDFDDEALCAGSHHQSHVDAQGREPLPACTIADRRVVAAFTSLSPAGPGTAGKRLDFSRVWLDEWDVANARCRFSELADTQMGVAYDRLAEVHGELKTVRLKY